MIVILLKRICVEIKENKQFNPINYGLIEQLSK